MIRLTTSHSVRHVDRQIEIERQIHRGRLTNTIAPSRIDTWTDGQTIRQMDTQTGRLPETETACYRQRGREVKEQWNEI